MNGMNSFCLVQVDDISRVQNNQIFDFADIDQNGMVDMIFLTDKKTMNFIVNYNMLPPPDYHSIWQDSEFLNPNQTQLNQTQKEKEQHKHEVVSR